MIESLSKYGPSWHLDVSASGYNAQQALAGYHVAGSIVGVQPG